jgi:ADP-heptose:LPS heptosyltransferase
VAAALKANFPDSSIVYLTHGSLIDLLKLCPCIDDFIAYDRGAGVAGLVSYFKQSDADLIIDLSGSLKARLATVFASKKALHYRKEKSERPGMQHAVNNFLATLSPLNLKTPSPLFPTVFPGVELRRTFEERFAGKTLIGLVPGVGRLRPHRAWPPEKWLELVRRLKASSHGALVLVGGEDDAEICRQIAASSDGDVTNLSGSLSLPETAALLSCCRLVVSGDTGPAHVAVAAGTRVVGLLGATYAQRSGPFGMEKLTIDVSHHCRCHSAKQCLIAGYTTYGRCMEAIEGESVEEKITLALSTAAT